MSKMIAKLKTAVFNGTLIPRSGCLSRPVSPKLAHEAVLAKPPYFDEASQWVSKMEEARFAGGESGKREKLKVKNTKRSVQRVSEWLSKMIQNVTGEW